MHRRAFISRCTYIVLVIILLSNCMNLNLSSSMVNIFFGSGWYQLYGIRETIMLVPKTFFFVHIIRFTQHVIKWRTSNYCVTLPIKSAHHSKELHHQSKRLEKVTTVTADLPRFNPNRLTWRCWRGRVLLALAEASPSPSQWNSTSILAIVENLRWSLLLGTGRVLGGIMTMLRLAKKIIMRMKDDFTNSKKKNGTIKTIITTIKRSNYCSSCRNTMTTYECMFINTSSRERVLKWKCATMAIGIVHTFK